VFVFRAIVVAAALVLGGLVVAWMITRDRKYLRIAAKILLWVLVLGVVLGLLYVFERVLVM